MDWSRATFNGPVQKVQQFRYAAKMIKRSKQITKGKLLETVTEQYDKQGRLLENAPATAPVSTEKALRNITTSKEIAWKIIAVGVRITSPTCGATFRCMTKTTT